MTQDHAAIMAREMRPADRKEYEAMIGCEPKTLALDDIRRKSTKAYAAEVDGELVLVWGILSATVLSTEAHPWLLATPAVERRDCGRELARRSKGEAAKLLRGYQKYSNFCDVENKTVVRWLKWLGFNFAEQTRPYNGVNFIYFWKDEPCAPL